MAAEFAIALPAVALVLAFGVGALATGARHVMLQDAAADGARLAARGESRDRVAGMVRSAVGSAQITVEDRGELVCVTLTAPAPLAALGTVAATGCALDADW